MCARNERFGRRASCVYTGSAEELPLYKRDGPSSGRQPAGQRMACLPEGTEISFVK
jgi:hypothetical protein